MSYNLKTTNTELFLVPPLGIGRGLLKEHGFIGAYLGDVNKPEVKYERGIFMLFRPPNMMLFNEWIEYEKERTPWMVDDYDYDGGYVVIIYCLEERLGRDYERFLKGEYSKFSPEFKSRFTKTVPVKSHMGRTTNELSWQWRIFKKDPEIRKHWELELWDYSHESVFTDDMEVWSVPDLDEKGKEMLDITIIRGDRVAYE
jgi:hypothetical protein